MGKNTKFNPSSQASQTYSRSGNVCGLGDTTIYAPKIFAVSH